MTTKNYYQKKALKRKKIFYSVSLFIVSILFYISIEGTDFFLMFCEKKYTEGEITNINVANSGMGTDVYISYKFKVLNKHYSGVTSISYTSYQMIKIKKEQKVNNIQYCESCPELLNKFHFYRYVHPEEFKEGKRKIDK